MIDNETCPSIKEAVKSALATATDSDEGLQKTLEIAGNGLGWRAIFAWALSDDESKSEDKSQLECVTSWVIGLPGIEALAVARRRESRAFDDAALGLAWQNAEMVRGTDMDPALLHWQGPAPIDKLHGWVCVPVCGDDRVLAVLECFSEQSIEFDQQLLETIGSIASTLGTFLAEHEMSLAERDARDSSRISEQVDVVLLHAILDHADAVMFARDGDGRYLFVNRGYEELFGVRNEELRGKTDHALFPAEVADMFRENDLQVVRGGHPVRVEEVVPTPAGTRTYLSTKFPMTQSSGIPGGICGMAVDITDRKRLEENREVQLRQEREQVMRLQQAVNHLAGGIAHEINTPIQFIGDNLQFIQNALEMLERSSMGDPSVRDGDVEFIKQELPLAVRQALEGTQRVAKIVDSMKSFGQKDGVEQARIDINRALESTIVVASHEWRDVADVETQFGDIAQVCCFGNSIGQVLLNLLVNACHAVAEKNETSGGRGNVTIRTWADGDDACISIADTGKGIPAEIREKIFDPFFTTKDVGKGTGQGLSLSRSIIESHKGSLSFDSNDDGGTTFTIRLPFNGTLPIAEAEAGGGAR